MMNIAKDCGCEIVQDPEGDFGDSAVALCDLHAAAPALYEFVKKLAVLKTCDEEPDNCESQSGPYCGRHDRLFYEDEILEARALIAKASGQAT